MFMTESAYAEAFGEPCVLNAVGQLTGTDEQKIELADRLAGATFVNVNSSTKVANTPRELQDHRCGGVS
ncbi:MAG: hypothetical protein ACLVKA_05705 [Collinsella aerofaciens]